MAEAILSQLNRARHVRVLIHPGYGGGEITVPVTKLLASQLVKRRPDLAGRWSTPTCLHLLPGNDQ